MENINYMQTIPNSHFWTNLRQIISSFDYQRQRETQEKIEKNSEYSTYIGEPFTKEYLLIGLNNSIKNGYHLMRIKYPERLRGMNYFASIYEMIEFIESEDYDDKTFYNRIKTMCSIGFNLTNGKKMSRQEVYKMIDGEREYQDMRWNTNLREDDIPDEEKPVAEWLNYIEYHLSKAKTANYHLSREDSLNELRKVAALTVRALEIHGCPARQIEVDDKPNCCAPDCNCKKQYGKFT